ncbi:alpha-tocopherol transfer protein-like isoform X3 [Mercenaria mercenaria]|uniref:alpha-tocopherol transfer protein-like isoform X3 n=1 Tax=Mercenaria mercenaria TaxID=6596 RepID=UPI00234F1CE9|nr:alpha-tocopherol transfer protein-like isoform X3 [Mercenaria mercenaria]
MATSNELDDTEYVCTLSDELIIKAEVELNEKPEWRERDIQALRDMILKKPELKIRMDDAYLLRFLRAKKFDYDRAFNLIMKHFRMRADEKNKQLFENLRPSAVKHVLDAGVTGVLPHRDRQGRRVMIFRPGKWDPTKYAIDDIFRANFISLTKLVEDSFPMRFKGIHYVNEPVVFDMVFAVIRPFMKQKILDRIHFHGSKYEELSEFIDTQYLPSEYGGTAPPFSNEEWTRTLLACEDEFVEDSKYGLVKAIAKPQTTCKDDTLDCLAGSYMNIDM